VRNELGITGTAVLILLGVCCVGYSRPVAAQECSQGCLTTYGYGYSRDNTNPRESYFQASTLGTSLIPQAKNSPDLNGIVYAQPLYVSQVSISGFGTKNVLFVATEENYVYALDADTINSQQAILWSKTLNVGSETAVPDSALPPAGTTTCTDISPEVGITGTPVIDTSVNLLYVVSEHISGSTISQRLNVLNLSDGSPAAPALDIGSALGSGFAAVNQNQRPGLALVSQGDTPGGPQVYVAWAGHCDSSITTGGLAPYTGWVAAFHYTPGSPAGTLSLSQSFNDEGSGGSDPQGGIWMSGAAPALSTAPESSTIADVYLATGNGLWNGTSQFGESVLRLHHGTDAISLTGLYTPKAWSILNNGSGANCASPLNMPPPYATGTTICIRGDWDLDSGGVILARPVGSGYLPPGDSFVVLAGGKEGVIYDLDPSNMTRSVADAVDPCTTGANGQTIQCFGAIQLPLPNCCTGGMFGNRGSAAFWGGNSASTLNALYVAGSQDSQIRAYSMTGNGGGSFTTSSLFGYALTPDGDANGLAKYPGSSPVVSWNASDMTNGAGNAVLWILATSAYRTGPAKIFAYSAKPNTQGQLSQLWPDTTNGPWASKFMLPTVINGHVYVGGQKPDPNHLCKTAQSGGSCLGRVVAWR
jgi:hypothetical protein